MNGTLVLITCMPVGLHPCWLTSPGRTDGGTLQKQSPVRVPVPPVLGKCATETMPVHLGAPRREGVGDGHRQRYSIAGRCP